MPQGPNEDDRRMSTPMSRRFTGKPGNNGQILSGIASSAIHRIFCIVKASKAIYKADIVHRNLAYLLYGIVFFSVLLMPTHWVFAEDFIFETNIIRFVMDSDGNGKSLQEKSTGSEWITPVPTSYVLVKSTSKSQPVTSFSSGGSTLSATFGSLGIQADYKITSYANYMTLELGSFQGMELHEIGMLSIKLPALPNAGPMVACRSNDSFVVCLMPLSPQVHCRLGPDGLISASVYSEFGMKRAKVAMIAAPISRFLEIVQEVERDQGLPCPQINGYWAKLSPDIQTNYLFTDLRESMADEIIRLARLGGFSYVLVPHSSWASTYGTYPINKTNFPRGEESLRDTIDKFHAARMKVGMHMMTSLFSKNDPLVTPSPDGRLLKDAEAVMVGELDARTTEVVATNTLAEFAESKHYLNDTKRSGIDIQINNEILHCSDIGYSKPEVFSKCIRGYKGTIPSNHPAGAKIHRLAERWGSYVVDLRTSLKDELADRVAGVINSCGFDMIYFDGGDVSDANGPGWYWGGQQQISIWSRVKRDLLVQGAGIITPWSWHIFSRMACDDYAAIVPKEYLDRYKMRVKSYFKHNFIPTELGWLGLLNNSNGHPATVPEEMEHFCVRMLATDTPLSIQTNLKMLNSNGRSEELFAILNEYTNLRSTVNLPKGVRENLLTGEWHLIKDGAKRRIYPTYYESRLLTLPCEVDIQNEGQPKVMQFRIQVLPMMAAPGSEDNVILFRAESPLLLSKEMGVKQTIFLELTLKILNLRHLKSSSLFRRLRRCV